MFARSLLIRTVFVAGLAVFSSAPEKADAFWYSSYGGYSPYYTGYAPSYGYGWGYRPLLQRRLDRLQYRANRLSYRNSFYGYPVYTAGYAGSACGCGVTGCCGTCGVTTNYLSSSCCGTTCGYSCCDSCGCSSGLCSSGDCSTGACGSVDYSSSSSSNKLEPTPVKPRETPNTFDRSDSDLDTRPNDGFGPNTGGSSSGTGTGGGRSDELPNDFSLPNRSTNPSNLARESEP